MIINLKNSKNLSTNDLRNSYQVQWWYIHEFYTDSLSFAVLSLVNSSLEQTHRCNINYYLDNQYHTLKNVPSESEFLFGEVITPSKCKKKKNCINSLKFLGVALSQNAYQRNHSGQYQKPYSNSHNNSIYSKWAKSRSAILSRA